MAKCKTNTKLYNDLLNDSNPEYRQRADFIFNLIMDTDFKDTYGDWAAIEDNPDERLDEDGNPTLESLKEYFKDNPERFERLPKVMLNSGVGTKSETEPEVAEIEKILTRISRRIRQLQRSTKMTKNEQKVANEAIRLMEEAEATGDNSKLIKFRQNSIREGYINELKTLQSRLISANERVGFKEYYKNAKNLLESINEALDTAGATDIGILAEYQMKLKFFANFEHINTIVKNNREIRNFVSKENDGGEAINRDKILGDYNALMTRLNEESIKQLARKWGQNPGKATAIARRTFTEFFQKEFPRKDDESRSEYIKRTNEYVNQKVEENSGFNEDGTPKSITRDEMARITQLLSNDPQDLSQLTSYMMDPRNMHNGIIDIAVKLLDRADYFSMRRTIKMAVETNKLVEDFYKLVRQEGVKGKDGNLVTNTRNMEEVYYTMIAKDKDGNLTRNLTGEYMMEPYQIRKELFQKVEEATEEGTNEEIAAAQAALDRYVSENFNRNVPVAKWKNPEYDFFKDRKNKDNAQYKLFWHLVDMGRDVNDFYYKDTAGGIRMPAIEKSGLERAFESGVLEYVKRTLGDFYKVRGEDVDLQDRNEEKEDPATVDEIEKWTQSKAYVHAFLDENGEQEKHIPIYYRRGDLVPISDQSFDLPSIFMLDYFGAINYYHKNEIKPELDLLQRATANRKYAPNHFGKKLFDKVPIAKNYSKIIFAEKEGDASNTYRALMSLYDDRLYGQRAIGGTPTIRKIASKIGQYTGDVMLIANIKSSLAAIAHSRSLQSIKALSGSIFGVDYALNDVVYAESKYWENTPSILADFGRIRPKAYVNLLGERFTAGQEWAPIAKRFAQATALSRIADKRTLHAMHGGAEHYVQHVLMLSYLHAIKVRNENGEYVDGFNNVVTNRNSAISVAEMYEIVDGKLQIKKGLKIGQVEFLAGNGRRVLDLSKMSLEEAEFKINQALLEINYYINGNYSWNNQSLARRHFVGKLVAGMRKWSTPGTMRRYRGMKTLNPAASTPRSELIYDDLFYSEHRDDFVYGEYLETSRFLKDFISAGRALGVKVATEEWYKRTDREKVAILNTVSEFVSMGLALAVSSLAAAAADDELGQAKGKYYILAFYSRRLFSELAFYINPIEAFRILRNPAASLNILENTMELMGQLTGDLIRLAGGSSIERYQRGKRRGQSKLYKEFRDVMPLAGQVEFMFFDDKNFEDSFGYLTKGGIFQ